MAQGAKPGEGGELPGHKVDDNIARIRYSTPGVGLISPPPHHDIYSIEDLKQLIHDLKNSNPSARVSVKLVSRSRRRHDRGRRGQGLRRSHPDLRRHRRHRRLAAHEHQARRPAVGARHRRDAPDAGDERPAQPRRAADRRRPQDGPRRGDRRACSAPRRFGFATAPLITLGCIMMRKCHLNTCPVGIATQDPVLRQEVRRQAGARRQLPVHGRRGSPADHGRARLPHDSTRWSAASIACETDAAIKHWKADGLDLTPLLDAGREAARRRRGLLHAEAGSRPRAGARQRADRAAPSRRSSTASRCATSCRSSTPTAPSARSSATRSPSGGATTLLPDDTIHFKFTGSAGRASARSWRRASRSSSKATRTTTSARAFRGGRLIIYPPTDVDASCPRKHHHRQRRAVRRDERRGVLPRPGRRAVLPSATAARTR